MGRTGESVVESRESRVEGQRGKGHQLGAASVAPFRVPPSPVKFGPARTPGRPVASCERLANSPRIAM